nr:MAG TPA: hypothetical protein [Bacteriophage sp.]
MRKGRACHPNLKKIFNQQLKPTTRSGRFKS